MVFYLSSQKRRIVKMRKYLTVSITTVFLIVSILVALSLSGCSSSKSKLVGKWQDIEKTGVMEFFSDNTVSSHSQGMDASGRWSILDDGRIKLEFTIEGISHSATGRIKGDAFQLETPDGKIEKYTKIK
jgi:hypothetical protein